MTMPPAAHPDHERLAALAGDDADARADRGLTDHIASCDTCERQVREMAILHSALADLPDLTPSRPLQLVPPVHEPASSGWRVAFRRAFAPVAVAGMVLVLVGGVGATGALGPAEAPRISLFFGQQAASAPDPAQPEMSGGDELQTDEDSQTDDAGRPAAASAPPADGGVGALGPTPTARGEINPLPAPEEPSAPTGENLDAESTLMSGWILLLAAGIALLAVAAALRALPPKGSPSRR